MIHSGNSTAQAQDNPTPASTESQTDDILQTQDDEITTITPSPPITSNLPILSLAKEYEIIGDRNNNKIIDPGDTVKYTITLANTSLEDLSLIVRDNINQEQFLQPSEISRNGKFNGQYIEWQLDLGVSSSDLVTYNVTLSDSLGDIGKIEIPNAVEVLRDGTPIATVISKLLILVPTPTISPTISFTPTISPTSVKETGATVLAESWETLIEIGLLAVVAMMIFTIISLKISQNKEKEDAEITEKRVDLVRDGVMIIFIVSAVLLMGISGTLPSDGVISILSAIVGYVFGRATKK